MADKRFMRNAAVLTALVHKKRGVAACRTMHLAVSRSFLLACSTTPFCWGVAEFVNCRHIPVISQ